MNHVHVFIISIALSSRNSCSNLLERGALIYQKARTIQLEYTKINPQFQSVKMKNERGKLCLAENLGGSKHSLFSAAIYMNFFADIIDKSSIMKSDRENENLHVIMLVNSYIISRHHSDLGEFNEFLDMFDENGKIQIIFESLKRGELNELYYGPVYKKTGTFLRKNTKYMKRFFEKDCSEGKRLRKIHLYIYAKLIYSLLISSDYYATSEFINGVKVTNFGKFKDIKYLNEIYENSPLLKQIRQFDPYNFIDDYKDINILRKCMFYEAEKNLEKNKGADVFFLEAPTGGGKSNIAMNCSFKLLDENINKIIYVYPFNTLVEQNLETLATIFGNSEILKDISVINSITPIKYDRAKVMDSNEKEENNQIFQKACLDRQFLNYPFILTTHVNLFQMIFGEEKESVFSFNQLAGSVIVLDEIQSYKNTIWTEIMLFLQELSELLNMKVIIMSATLPKLNYLTQKESGIINLITNSKKYFTDPRFMNRVSVSYELLEQIAGFDELLNHVINQTKSKRKILIEFIKKGTANNFYKNLIDKKIKNYDVELMTGDDNQMERSRILNKIKMAHSVGIILVATQVVEAGVDIDMDIGYKDISKLDSDEQFLGRINRNFKRKGVTYFFDLDNASQIYRNDYRINRGYTLSNENMRTILKDKNFSYYYDCILSNLKKMWNESAGDNGIENFVNNEVGKLNFIKVNDRMKLIEDNNWDMSVFLARTIQLKNGEILDGEKVWKEYKETLCNTELDFSRKKVRLSEIRSQLSYFVYQINKNSSITYNDRIGELYKIDDASKYFENEKLDREKLSRDGGLFLDC